MKSSSVGSIVLVLLLGCGQIAATASGPPEDGAADAGAAPPGPSAPVMGESTVAFWAPGEHFIGVAGTSDTDVWAVGSRNNEEWVIRHWDGASWSVTPTSARGTAIGIWARALDDAWAVGTDGIALHWDGTSWSATDTSSFVAPGTGQPTPDCVNEYDGCGDLGQTVMQSVFGFAANDVWAVGSLYPDEAGRALVVHYDGTHWTRVSVDTSPGTPLGVWGSSPSDLWVVGTDGATQHWNGSQWERRDGATHLYRYGIWGASANEVWAVGNGASVTRFDGSSWLPFSNEGYIQLYAVAGASAYDVWVVGSATDAESGKTGRHVRRWNGARWSSCNALEMSPLRSVWVSDTGKVWVVGGGIEEISAAARQCTE